MGRPARPTREVFAVQGVPPRPVLRAARALLALGALLCAAAPLHATLLPSFDLAQLTARADRIVRGRVVAQTGLLVAPAGRVVTDTRVEVHEVLKGAPVPAQIVVRRPGGKVGDTEVHVVGAPTFAIGEDVVLFLRVGAAGHALVGLAQGKFAVRSVGGEWRVFPAPRAARAAPAETALPVVRPAGVGPRDVGEPYAGWRDRIQSLVRSSAAPAVGAPLAPGAAPAPLATPTVPVP